MWSYYMSITITLLNISLAPLELLAPFTIYYLYVRSTRQLRYLCPYPLGGGFAI